MSSGSWACPSVGRAGRLVSAVRASGISRWTTRRRSGWSRRCWPWWVNGPEFIAQAIRRWLAQAGVETLYVEPGSPWENGYAESFHSRLRDELTDREEFTSLAEAKHLADAWRLEYNHRRPHSSLGYRTPAEFAAGCRCGFRSGCAYTPARSSTAETPVVLTQPILS